MLLTGIHAQSDVGIHRYALPGCRTLIVPTLKRWATGIVASVDSAWMRKRLKIGSILGLAGYQCGRTMSSLMDRLSHRTPVRYNQKSGLINKCAGLSFTHSYSGFTRSSPCLLLTWVNRGWRMPSGRSSCCRSWRGWSWFS